VTAPLPSKARVLLGGTARRMASLVPPQVVHYIRREQFRQDMILVDAELQKDQAVVGPSYKGGEEVDFATWNSWVLSNAYGPTYGRRIFDALERLHQAGYRVIWTAPAFERFGAPKQKRS